ncbi:glycosyltransferase [Fimbriiglobus ruber]|uniref:Glycosyltransferase n=1 Tax=Fimbriiglobus ruber TaxID=1908690 RepID=A0A225DA34_9BACT|nr:glycosyltransferase [Fimbriiglobus ruber]OWK34156.1 Glycosyltransferase [Fimbriiglobus ruber]
MKVAYLVNQYPQLSHSFIRREIQALERLGVNVVRLSVRHSGTLIDTGDRAEAAKTTAVLGLGRLALLGHVLALLLARPRSWVRGTATAARLARRGGGWVRHLAYFVEACAVARLCRRAGAHHLHAHFGTNPAAVALLSRQLGGPTYSFTVHGPEEFDRPDALSLGEKIGGAAFVVAISDFGRSQLYRWCPLADWPKVRVVRCGVDAVFRSGDPSPVPAVPRLINIGRLSEQKGQLLLVQAAARVRDSGLAFELAVIGDGPLRDVIEAEIARLNLGGIVKLLGSLPGDAVRRELLGSRAMVLPSFAEGLPVVLMEALGLGRPVVTTFIAGIPELVEPGRCGWLVPAGSVDALADAMAAVLTTPDDDLTRMGKVGAGRVGLMHDVDVEASKLAGFFRAHSEEI